MSSMAPHQKSALAPQSRFAPAAEWLFDLPQAVRGVNIAYPQLAKGVG